MSYFFEFEDDFVASLRCIPMIVRYKLDTCGVKLKLAHWNQFPQSERQILVEQPTTTLEEIQSYRHLLQQLAEKYTDIPLKDLPIEENPAWLDTEKIPETVEQKATETGVKLTLYQWQNLTPLQRFALIKLSRPSHENHNFLPAIKEFNLV
ncbi:MAG: nitrate reductase associated protein [Lyngbya sp.]|nr:nitrate reductase associated protein [Lyngbya sp.]